MYLDPRDHRTNEITDTIMANMHDHRELGLIQILQPKFSLDGNQYCYLYGELPNNCVIGFGDTPIQAARDFFNNFYNQKANTQLK